MQDQILKQHLMAELGKLNPTKVPCKPRDNPFVGEEAQPENMRWLRAACGELDS